MRERVIVLRQIKRPLISFSSVKIKTSHRKNTYK